MSVSSWEPDPTGRHQYRWFDGEEWTDQVADHGIQAVDPVSKYESSLPRDAHLSPPPPQTGEADDHAASRSEEAVAVAVRLPSLASPLRRLGARIIDSIIVVFPAILVAYAIPVDSDSDAGSFVYLFVAGGLAALMGILYEVTMIATRGQTLGKMAAHIMVIRSDSGLQPGWGKSLGRWALPYGMGIIPLFGWLMALVCYLSLTWGHNHQGWHDKAARTFVIKKP